jgi:nucleoside-triphosphatase THEP1
LNEPKKIFILSGPIQSGKTTTLINWVKGRSDVSGILTPVINGKRFFMDAGSREIFAMEAEQGESNVLRVGKYIFSASAFERANRILDQASKQKEGLVIIDEVGPLELKGEGFSDMLKKILNGGNEKLKIILVIRESLVKDVLTIFRIENYQDFKQDEL